MSAVDGAGPCCLGSGKALEKADEVMLGHMTCRDSAAGPSHSMLLAWLLRPLLLVDGSKGLNKKVET